MAVSLDIQRILEHTLGIAPDTSLTVTEVLDTLQSHFKNQRNEALRRRELLCCKQADSESFSDFFVFLKNLAEEVDLCTGNAMTCAEIQLKMVLLMGVRDEELIQRLISLDTVYDGHASSVICMSVVNKLMYTGDIGGQAKGWVWRYGDYTCQYKGHTHSITALKFHQGILYSGSADGQVRAFNAKMGVLWRAFRVRRPGGGGSGEANLKKSWHPSTMKNQERVWKAEQQKAEEDRKMAELQRELKEEREREGLKRTAQESGAIARKGEEKLDWMYKGPGGHVSREEYLLGRKIDKALEQLEQAEATEEPQEGEQPPQQSKSSYTIEHEINPESVIRREQSDIQVDMHRKLMEDPLLLIRKQEEETKRQITNNPVKMKQLQQLIASIKSKKSKKSSKRSDSSDSSSSSSDSESEDEKKEKKKKKRKKKRQRRPSPSSSSSSEDTDTTSSSESDKAKKYKKKKKKAKSKKKRKEKSSKTGITSDLKIRIFVLLHRYRQRQILPLSESITPWAMPIRRKTS
ncbi:Pre-mRNA-splicing factor CWC25 [Chionoecetes opilio]|uniref:Pre-mRNA-splicing factor CWC25 n=1 Tax=Chionoecetes opilio TaxID=41210 RepID=A0A8J4YCG2_CHIOP|nr:Pre-mRNA-splicing factor CWC25 [Chionoecetes opilio]